ncbi:hypothetical protein Btru_041802 [Bulinus truncatus]|nr:hypothetical protein Btru_041802 [Bulinus truncatus]
MLKVSDKNVLSEFYSINCIHILAQQITVLINIAKLDKSRDLQKLALECMLQFMQTETDFGKENALKLGNLFAHCLPGIVTGMVFVVTGSTNQGQAVFVKATSVCCRLLTLTMSDELLQECQKQIESNKLNGIDPREAIDAPLRSLYIERNEAWLKSTSTHLSPVINAFCTLVSNSHWRVRQALVEFAEQLLMTCSRSLSQYIHKLLESLVGLIHDPYKSVSTKAVQVLETFEYSHSGSVEEKTLTEILEENIFNLAASLPRLIKFSDEENKPHLINLLRGYITLLGNIYILVDHMLELYQESVVYKLSAVLVINEMIVGASHSVKNGTCQVTETQLLKDVIKMLIDEYLSPSNLKLIKDITSSQQQSAKNSTSTSLVIIKQDHTLSQQDNSLANKNRTILLTCLFMEGLGKFATAIGKDFEVHLIKTLYPLVENLGHENLYLSSTAYSSLVEVAFACGYSSLDKLIRNNADYLVACVSQRLRHFDEHYRAPRTICVILRYCSKDLLYLISHSITQLFESLDDNYSQHLILFMPVLLELVSAIGRWFPSQIPPAEQEELKQEKCTLDSEELISCITEYMKNKTILHEYLSDGSLPDIIKQERTLNDIEADMKEVISEQSELKGEQEDEKMAEEEEAANKELPKHVQIVQESQCDSSLGCCRVSETPLLAAAESVRLVSGCSRVSETPLLAAAESVRLLYWLLSQCDSSLADLESVRLFYWLLSSQ